MNTKDTKEHGGILRVLWAFVVVRRRRRGVPDFSGTHRRRRAAGTTPFAGSRATQPVGEDRGGRPAIGATSSVAELLPWSFKSRRSLSGSRSTPRFLISSWPMLRSRRCWASERTAEWQQIDDFEAGERRVGDRPRPREVGWAGASAASCARRRARPLGGRRGRRGRRRRRSVGFAGDCNWLVREAGERAWRDAASGWKDRCAVLAGRCARMPCQATSWRHSRSRLIHSQFATFGPIGRYDRWPGRASRPRAACTPTGGRSLRVRVAPFERRRAAACGAAVGIDVPGGDVRQHRSRRRRAADGCAGVGGGEMGGNRIDRRRSPAIPARRLAGRRRCRSRGRPRSGDAAAVEAGGFVPGDPFVRRLLEAVRVKNMRSAWVNFGRRSGGGRPAPIARWVCAAAKAGRGGGRPRCEAVRDRPQFVQQCTASSPVSQS